MNDTPLRILFLCTGNSCRSQMAEAWARSLKPGVIAPASAGVERHGMNPLVKRVMAEAGVDLSGQYSKLVEDLDSLDFHWVITLCGHAKESCPRFPGRAHQLHHGFDDPAALGRRLPDDEALPHYRRVRDEIRAWVETLPQSLPSASESAPMGFSV
ncbi:arsenate reductase ArsC [Desulfocurvus sp. DL9XJH121]